MAGTLSIETIVKISLEQPSPSDIISIFESGGSSGNSTIFLPSSVKFPVLLSAPRIQS
jgi:hypothetical protein